MHYVYIYVCMSVCLSVCMYVLEILKIKDLKTKNRDRKNANKQDVS